MSKWDKYLTLLLYPLSYSKFTKNKNGSVNSKYRIGDKLMVNCLMASRVHYSLLYKQGLRTQSINSLLYRSPLITTHLTRPSTNRFITNKFMKTTSSMLLVSNLHFLSDQATPQLVHVLISRSLEKMEEKEAGEQFGGAWQFSINYAQFFFFCCCCVI